MRGRGRAVEAVGGGGWLQVGGRWWWAVCGGWCAAVIGVCVRRVAEVMRCVVCGGVGDRWLWRWVVGWWWWCVGCGVCVCVCMGGVVGGWWVCRWKGGARLGRRRVRAADGVGYLRVWGWGCMWWGGNGGQVGGGGDVVCGVWRGG